MDNELKNDIEAYISSDGPVPLVSIFDKYQAYSPPTQVDIKELLDELVSESKITQHIGSGGELYYD